MNVRIVEIGTFKLDGGAMFGVVPKQLWHQKYPADENNMCTWSMRSILIEDGDRKILVDTGIGNKQDDKFKSHFYPDGPVANESIAQYGIRSEEITDVFLTHFHFDHAGGAISNLNGKLVPTFPNATYWSNQIHYEWAINPNPREKASFLQENILPLQKNGKLQFIDYQTDDLSWNENIKVRFLNGHTRAMMMLILNTDEGILVFPTDLLPSQWHTSLPFVMSYDIEPLKTLEEKERFLSEAIDKQYKIILQHDLYKPYGHIELDERGRYIFV